MPYRAPTPARRQLGRAQAHNSRSSPASAAARAWSAPCPGCTGGSTRASPFARPRPRQPSAAPRRTPPPCPPRWPRRAACPRAPQPRAQREQQRCAWPRRGRGAALRRPDRRVFPQGSFAGSLIGVCERSNHELQFDKDPPHLLSNRHSSHYICVPKWCYL